MSIITQCAMNRYCNVRLVRLLLAALACACLLSTDARAQDDNTRNAATWYGRAFADLEKFTPEEMEQIEAYRANPGGAPSPEVRALINRAAPIIDNLMRASSQGYSDFGLDYSVGFDLLLPHLSKMRAIARLVHADSAMRLSDGDGAGAAHRIAALYRLADHAGDDHVLISSLVGRAMFEVAEKAAQAGFDRGAFDPASAMVLLRSTQAYDQGDPFQSIEALAMEQTLCMSMIREHFMGDDPVKRSEMLEMLARDGQLDEEFAALTPEELEVHVGRYTALMDRYVEIWAMEDPAAAREQLQQIEKELEEGQHGLIAQLLTPALGRAYDAMMAGRDKLHARIELLEAITKGQVDLQTLTNAAVWYRRGIEQMESLDEPWTEGLAALDAGRPLTAEQIAALDATADSARAAIGQFVEGSNIRRCDFSTERHVLEIFVPAYGGGMRDAFRLLSLEALRLAAADDVAGSAQMLAAAFGMCAHLSNDNLLVSAMVSRDGFLLISRTAAGIESRNHFDEAARQQLAAAIRRCGTSDPFGFIGATLKAREYLRDTLVQWGPPEQRDERKERLEAWLKGVDADGLVYLMAMLDVLEFDLTLRKPFNLPGAQRLDEYLLADTMELAAIDAPTFAALLKEGRAQVFKLPETMRLVGATERMASARQDQWTTIAWAHRRAEVERAELQSEEPPGP